MEDRVALLCFGCFHTHIQLQAVVNPKDQAHTSCIIQKAAARGVLVFHHALVHTVQKDSSHDWFSK